MPGANRFDLMDSEVHVRCGADRPCGFLVNDNYFEEKKQFVPGVCPRCGGPIVLVAPYTAQLVATHEMDMQTGRIRPVKKAK